MSVFADLSEEEAYLWAILTDASGIDQAEFTWYEADAEGECWRAWPFQWPWWHSEDRLQIDSAGRSVGKALSLDTLIPTPSGWSTMGQIQVGDYVFNGNGEPVEVLEAFEVQEDRPCYRIEFDDSSEVIADGDHLWKTWTHHERKQANRRDRIGLGKVEKQLPHTRTTFEIANTLRTNTKSQELNHRVDVAKSLKLEEMNLPIPPYLLGYWLGDGHTAGGRITIGEQDKKESCKLLEQAGAQINPGSSPTGYGISYKGEFLGYCLTRLGVTGNKHIPAEYLRGSYEQRLELLQGLMDSDGHCRPDGRCEITQKLENLAVQIFELLCTLGQKPFFETKTAYCNGKDCGPVYRIGFHPVDLQPFQLARKMILIKNPRWKTRVTQRRIQEVTPIESVPVRCIRVDSSDHLFLIGRTFIPTHNSTGISVRSFSFVFRYPGKELVLTAPEAIHLDLITQKIEQRIMSVRLLREMITKKRQIRHRPFEVDFQNGSRIVGRIPHRDGGGMKGTHGIVIELDEGQDYSDAAWEEVIETLNRSSGGDEARWMVHGVTRGIRDYFHKFTQPGSGWTVHKVPSMIRPGWTDEEREEKIAMYGSRNAPSYRRNILGDPGDAEASIFVVTRLMQCVDLNEGSNYNQLEYHCERIAFERLSEDQITIEQALQLPLSHKEMAQKYTTWGGADLGMTSHPSEYLVFAEIPRKGETSLFKLIARFHLERVRARDQVSAIIHLIDYYDIKAFGLDKTGLGLPIYQDLQDRAPEYLDRIKGYNFSSKILVDFDKSIEVDSIKGDRIKDSGIEKNVLEESTDVLRRLVDTNRMRLPNDLDVIKEFQGQTYQNIKTGMDQYGRSRRFSTGTFHALDAARMAGLAFSQHAIEELVKPQENEDVLDVFFIG